MADRPRLLRPDALRRDSRIPIRALDFIPVPNTGERTFSLSYDGSVLRLHSAGKTYQIELRLEEES